MADILDKLTAGANLALRIYLRTERLFVDPADETSLDVAKLGFSQLLRRPRNPTMTTVPSLDHIVPTRDTANV